MSVRCSTVFGAHVRCYAHWYANESMKNKNEMISIKEKSEQERMKEAQTIADVCMELNFCFGVL